MQYLTDDVRISGMEEAAAPEYLIEELPISQRASQLVFNLRRRLSDIIAGQDDRLAVVAGPCSIHDPKAAMEYAERLAEQADRLAEDLCVIMRVYFEKPRTTVGWKGLINDPHLDGTFDINLGLRTARQLLHDIVDLGLGTGTEYLDPISPQYYGDLVCWGAIGARTTESQIHRQLASGLSCPVGFKNSTNGNIQVAADAVKSATNEHVFLSVTKSGHSAIFQTTGNKDCHIILRGGGGETNYDNPSVHYASKILEQAGLLGSVMVDMSHANAQRDPPAPDQRVRRHLRSTGGWRGARHGRDDRKQSGRRLAVHRRRRTRLRPERDRWLHRLGRHRRMPGQTRRCDAPAARQGPIARIQAGRRIRSTSSPTSSGGLGVAALKPMATAALSAAPSTPIPSGEIPNSQLSATFPPRGAM